MTIYTVWDLTYLYHLKTAEIFFTKVANVRDRENIAVQKSSATGNIKYSKFLILIPKSKTAPANHSSPHARGKPLAFGIQSTSRVDVGEVCSLGPSCVERPALPALVSCVTMPAINVRSAV